MRPWFDSELGRAIAAEAEAARALEVAAKPPRRRDFAAASINRLTASWSSSTSSINSDLEAGLAILVGRSRWLTANTGWGKRFIGLVRDNVVGPKGPRFKCKAEDPSRDGKLRLDIAGNAAVERHFARWARRGMCDTTGQLSFALVCRQVIEACARDGEALVLKRYSRNYEYGFRLRVLEADRLDYTYTTNLQNGNQVRMGVEIDADGRPVAYHILTAHPSDNAGFQTRRAVRERVPAENVYHVFLPIRPEQLRGVPWAHAVMMRSQMISGFEEAAVTAARVGASKMGFFKRPDGDGSPLADEQTSNGELLTSAEPGTFGVLPEGTEFVDWNPDYPHANFAEFLKASLRDVAAGLEVAFHNLTGDGTNVTYSSARIFDLDERDVWTGLQDWFIEAFALEVARDWLTAALVRRAITFPSGGAIPGDKLTKFADGLRFFGRRWPWVDPNADAKAIETKLANRLTSRTRVAAEQGEDLDEILQECADEEARMTELGVEVNPTPPGQPAPADATPPASA